MSEVLSVVVLLVVVAGVVGFIYYRRNQTQGTDQATGGGTPATRGKQYLSQAGQRSGTDGSGVLVCPYCGSSQFQAKRSAAGKSGGCALGCLFAPFTILLAPLFALLAPKSRVRCVACGREFLRG